MSRRKNGAAPPYCLHGQSRRAYVRLNGQQIMLGPHGSPESRELYHRVVAEWEANGRRLADLEGKRRDFLVVSLCAAYREHCGVYYRRKDGMPTMENTAVKNITKRLEALYAGLPAAEFGARQLKTVRDAMIREGFSRVYINDQVGRLVRMFRWGAEEELVPADVFGRLRAVRRLQAGRSEARETEPRQPVSEAHMRAVLPQLSRHVRAMVLAMWHTAMRCGEVVQLRTRDVDMTGGTWVFRPAHHKNAHRGRSREIDIGPEAQDVLREFITLDPDARWFRPKDAYRDHLRKRRAARKSKLWDSHLRVQQEKRAACPKRRPGDEYDTHEVRRAITRACRRLRIQPWTPHQLRHAALTRIRERFGIEAAIAIGGHASFAMAEHYTARAQRTLAARVISTMG